MNTEFRDNLPPVVRHLLKYLARKNYRAWTPLRRTSYKSITSRFLEERIRKSGVRLKVCELGAFSPNSLDVGIRRLMQYDFCDFIVVEPQREEAEAIREFWARTLGPARVKVIETAVGNGKEIEFRICNESSAFAGLEPNLDFFDRFPNFWRNEPMQVIRRVRMKTQTLDSVLNGNDLDYLTMDIQGMELDVLKASPRTLSGLLVLECEAQFQEMYKGAPLFGQIFDFMRGQGFELFSFRKVGALMGKEFRARPSWTWYPWRSNFFEPREVAFAQPIFVRTDFRSFIGDYAKVWRAAFVLEKVYLAYDQAHRLLQTADKYFKQDFARAYYESLPDKIKATSHASPSTRKTARVGGGVT